MTVGGRRAEGRGAARGRLAPGLALRLREGQRGPVLPRCVLLRALVPPPAKVARTPRPRRQVAAMMAAGCLHRERAQRCGPGRSARAKSCRCCLKCGLSVGKPPQAGVRGQVARGALRGFEGSHSLACVARYQ